MRISELIARLRLVQNEMGDIRVRPACGTSGQVICSVRGTEDVTGFYGEPLCWIHIGPPWYLDDEQFELEY